MAQLAVNNRELVIGHTLHEIAIVRDQKQRSRPTIEQVLNSCKHVDIKIVSRLVEDQNIGLLKQNHHERKTATLPA